MKKTALLLLFITLSACNSKENNEKQKRLIVETMQKDRNGTKTDLKIEFSKFDISDITVGDSISILNEEFQKKKEKQIGYAEGNVKRNQKDIEEINQKLENSKRSSTQKLTDKGLKRMKKSSLKKAKTKLEKVRNWNPAYLNRYEDRDKSEILVKKAVATFSYFNAKLNTRQERTETFVLSKDESKVLGLILKGQFIDINKN
ncbi:MAG: hypothetical protein L0J49_03345 [Lactococcus lactis]|nr:hypothetical protein [Lactococcus lactis]MDN6342678.1 hypothetical protein [Lactococcus lactis]